MLGDSCFYTPSRAYSLTISVSKLPVHRTRPNGITITNDPGTSPPRDFGTASSSPQSVQATVSRYDAGFGAWWFACNRLRCRFWALRSTLRTRLFPASQPYFLRSTRGDLTIDVGVTIWFHDIVGKWFRHVTAVVASLEVKAFTHEL